MSARSSATSARTLPERPSLEHLRNEARQRLRALRASSPGTKLTEAQLQIARDYGFASWREMKASIEGGGGGGRGRLSNCVGFYRHDPGLIANAVVSVTARDGGLRLEAVNGARFDMIDQGDGRFAIPGLETVSSFEGAEDGPATAMISHFGDSAARLERISPAEARAIRAARDRADAEQRRPRQAIAVDPKVFDRYVGHYVSEAGLGLGLEVFLKDGRLLVQLAGQPALEVFPESETRFFYRVVPAQLEFLPEGGRASAVIIHQNGIEQRLNRASAEEVQRVTARIRERAQEQERPRVLARIDPAVLAGYVGRYRVDAARTLTVSTEDGRLYIEITGQPRLEVYPESETTFFWTVVAAQITFVTGPGGRATHAVLHQAGRDVPMPREDDQEPGA